MSALGFWHDPLFKPGRAVQWVGARIEGLGQRIAQEFDPHMHNRESAWLDGQANGYEGAISVLENSNYTKEEAVALLRDLAEQARS
jgi:hypothetical protein